jgi:hypothetical protein
MIQAGIEAAKTTASPAEIWGIVVVAVACLAFWLSMINWADRNPRYKHSQIPDMHGPVLGGIHFATGGRSVAPNRDAPALFTEAEEEAEEAYEMAGATTRADAPAEAAAAGGAGGAPAEGRPWVPSQRPAEPQQAPVEAAQASADQAAEAQSTGQASAAADMPTQRTGESDRAERSVTGPADQRGDEK